jgi:uncharacterized protein YqjF (DUF2071 family)
VAIQKVFLTAQWKHLAMLNYAVNPDLLRPLIPQGTELDFYGGKAYISLVGFLFEDTRVMGAPIPFHRNFEEINLRFYVRRRSPEGLRRGVVFIREIVPRWAIAAVARLIYNEKYVALPMWHRVEPARVEYGWRHGTSNNIIHISPLGDAFPAEAGSEEQFITEHYWGYSVQRGGGTVEYQVSHPAWRVRRAGIARFKGEVASLYGEAFARIVRGQPDSAFLADGSPVEVMRGSVIAESAQASQPGRVSS